MKIPGWIKDKLEKLELHNNKKLLTNLLILLCAGVTMVVVANFFNDISLKNKSDYENNSITNGADTLNDYSIGQYSYEENMEKQLSYILSKIDNAGKVSVMITYKSSKEFITDKDSSKNDKITNEKDNDGGIRVINELSTNDKTVLISEQGSNSKAVITKEINPEIKGIIVVAEGAKDVKVKQKLTDAVQTVLDIPAYRVIVLETK
ncbi:MAG: stage III sporulation protein AG [Firmicutes bacterium]|nr:stage III sporulation protein AG [Bacillota bacterium]